MMDAKAKWQQDIETATGPNSALAQLLNARMFDLEVIVLAQAAKIEELERQQATNIETMRNSIQAAVKTITRELRSREIREELRQSKKRGFVR